MPIAVKERSGITETLARVLVSSSDAQQIRELSARLGACGLATLSADTGTAALRMVREARPDLVVLGADADGGRAIAVAEGIKQSADTRHVPVAIVARHAGPTFRRACLAAGIDDVIIGPVADPVLMARLTPLFRLSTMTSELQRRRESLRSLGLAAKDQATVEPESHQPLVLFVNNREVEGEGSAVESALAGDCAISYAADAFAAAETLTNAQFDALVLLPDNDVERTLHFCSHIRNNPRLFNLPVLLVTDPNVFEDLATPYRRGASLVLTRPYDPSELRDQVLSLVRRQRQRHAVRQGLATTLQKRTEDAITGLYSGAFFAGHLSRLIASAGLSLKPLSAVVFDLQNIAWFERQYGEGTGERVLRQIARWIAGLVRAEDLPARVGEASFAVALPDTGYDEAQVVANRIAGVLLNTDFSVEDGLGADPLRVWVETGTAVAEPGDTVEGLIARARARMS
jgi:two-component system cell cycle response regulator